MKTILLLMASLAAFSATDVCVEYKGGELCASKTNWGSYSKYEDITFNSHPDWNFKPSQLRYTTDSNTLCALFKHERPTRLMSLTTHYVCSVVDLNTGESFSVPTYRKCYRPYRAVKHLRCI